MYLVSLMVEDINRNIGNEIVTNVGKVVEIKELSPENLKPVMDELCNLAFESQFMRKGN